MWAAVERCWQLYRSSRPGVVCIPAEGFAVVPSAALLSPSLPERPCQSTRIPMLLPFPYLTLASTESSKSPECTPSNVTLSKNHLVFCPSKLLRLWRSTGCLGLTPQVAALQTVPSLPTYLWSRWNCLLRNKGAKYLPQGSSCHQGLFLIGRKWKLKWSGCRRSTSR